MRLCFRRGWRVVLFDGLRRDMRNRLYLDLAQSAVERGVTAHPTMMNDMFVRLVITSSRSCCTLRFRRRLRGNRRRLFRSRRMAMYQGRPLWPRRAARSDFLDRHDAFHRTHEITANGLTGADVCCSKANVAAGGCRISQAERYELLRYLIVAFGIILC